MAFKIQLISDTHTFDYTLNKDADLIIHCGDFSNGRTTEIDKFVDKCNQINKPHLFVLGNHDFMYRYIEDVYQEIESKGYNYLREGKEFKFKNKTFIGGTLFTNFQLYTTDPIEISKYKDAAEFGIRDFLEVSLKKTNKYVIPDDYITLFNIQYNWINKYRNRDDVIVLSHFVPNIAGLDPYYAEHSSFKILNPYFVNNIDLKGFKYWFCGHTHTAFDLNIDGCHYVCNPYGYPNEHDRNDFRKNLLIEIK